MRSFFSGLILAFAALAASVTPVAQDAPEREPQLAASGSNVGLTFGSGNAIYFKASQDEGRTFSKPVKIADAGIIPLNRHRGPRIVMFGRTVVITAVVGSVPAAGQHAHGLPSDGDLMSWVSRDSGKSFSKGGRVNDVPGAPTEGLHGLAAGPQGQLFAAWLDKRTGNGTQLYGALSTDGGATWSKNELIYASPDGTICECCHPSVAIDRSGQIIVMWRNAVAGTRDMYLTRSRAGVKFSKPEKLGAGTWQLKACPMDGGGLVLSHNRVVTAWRREHEIFLASPGEKETAIADGVDVALAGDENGVYAVWSTPEGVRALKPGSAAPVVISRQGGFPAVVALAHARALAAWEENGTIRTGLL